MQRLAMGLEYFAAQSSFLRQIFVLLFSAREIRKTSETSGPAMPAGKGSRVFVGNLPESARERDLERFFEKYGRIRSGH